MNTQAFIDIEIGRDDPRLLALFDGMRREWGVVEIMGNVDSGGRRPRLGCGAAINQCREGGKWKCLALIGWIPRAILDGPADGGEVDW